MDVLIICLKILGVIVPLFLIALYVCFYFTFLAPRKKGKEITIPLGKAYEPYFDIMQKMMDETKSIPHREVTTTSFDGLTLAGKFYEYNEDAPIELMLHGYRGSAERDLCGGVMRCFRLGRSALIVDQRTSGKSDGNVISFGINESRDCLSWIDFIIKNIGKNRKIILTGISMGAATVMITAGKELPNNVIGALADCGYTSAKDIIKKVIRDVKMPANLLYPIIKFSAKWFGRFDLDETSPEESLKNAKIPIMFIHGEADKFVPCEMSKKNFDVCSSPKKLVTFEGAEHGLSYLVDTEKYIKEVKAFDKEMGI